MLVYIAVAILTLIAVLHSVLGESALLEPLFRREWELGIPRFAAERILRFAWHLTSVAWLGLAAAVAGVPVLHATAAVCVVSAAAIFVMLRGHLAWPLFLAVAACLWASIDALPQVVLRSVTVVGAVLLAAMAVLHAYWGLGGRWGVTVAVPSREDGSPAFTPGPTACFAVAAACVAFGVLVVWPSLWGSTWPVRAALWIALAVLALRAMGDGKQVGFSKTRRDTAFARADDALYLPLVVTLALSCGAALLLG